jgi:hypothetical protein
MSEQVGLVPSEEERREIEAERERRLDPANRPERAEVDNTGVTLPAVEEFERQAADEDDEAAAGTADPTAGFREVEVSDEERAELEEERKRRLDPANRPENTEIDNTGRTFEGDRFVD